jgi:hypothetical protein
MRIRTGRPGIFTGNLISHRGKTITDIGSSVEYKDFLNRLENFTQSKVAIVPNDMEGRPDKIAFAAYGNEKLWWLIVLANQAYDYEVDLAAGKQILIPQT